MIYIAWASIAYYFLTYTLLVRISYKEYRITSKLEHPLIVAGGKPKFIRSLLVNLFHPVVWIYSLWGKSPIGKK